MRLGATLLVREEASTACGCRALPTTQGSPRASPSCASSRTTSRSTPTTRVGHGHPRRRGWRADRPRRRPERGDVVGLSNETHTNAERQRAANVAAGIPDRVLQSANATFGDRYIFAGDAYDAAAFDATGAYRATLASPMCP